MNTCTADIVCRRLWWRLKLILVRVVIIIIVLNTVQSGPDGRLKVRLLILVLALVLHLLRRLRFGRFGGTPGRCHLGDDVERGMLRLVLTVS